jgi:subtilisin family serine protease
MPFTSTPVDTIGLGPLMALETGSPDVRIGLIDGPVRLDHPDLAGALIRPVDGAAIGCRWPGSAACRHGTFIAGILVARRGAPALSICPGCTLLVRPIFAEAEEAGEPSAKAEQLALAIVACVRAGARIINLSSALGTAGTRAEAELRGALDYAAVSGTLIVVAAGNQAMLGGSEITRHPGVIPVVAYDRAGRPMAASNIGRSVGQRGVGAPGEGIPSLAADDHPVEGAGTSVAAAIVTGAAALLWSRYPRAEVGVLRRALTHGGVRTSVVPPLLDLAAAQNYLADTANGCGSSGQP